MDTAGVTETGAPGAGNPSRGDRDGATEVSGFQDPGGICPRRERHAGTATPERGAPSDGGGDGRVFPSLPHRGAGGTGGRVFPPLPPQGAGDVDGGVFPSLPPEGAGGRGAAEYPPRSLQGVEGGAGGAFPPPPSLPPGGGTKRSPAYHGDDMTSGREPPARFEHHLMEEVTGPQRGPKTLLPYRQPYGFRWTLC